MGFIQSTFQALGGEGPTGSLFSPSNGAGFQAANAANPAAINQFSPVTQGQVQGSVNDTTGLIGALQAQNGIQNQSQVYNQLQGIANGTGPNPAQAQLAQATGANVANQSALMAGQRGAGANAGLLARQAAQQGAATQQQAAGQAATMQAQQSLGAIGAAGQLANQQANQYIGAQTGQEQQLLGAQLTGQQQQVSNVGNMNTVNASIAQGNQKAQAGLIGGILGSAGTSGQAVMGAEGGQVQRFDQGGYVNPFQGLGKTDVQQYQAPADSNPVGQGSGQFGQMIAKGLAKGASAAFNGIKNAFSSGDVHSQFLRGLPDYTMPSTGSQFSGATPTLGTPTQLPSSAGNAMSQAVDSAALGDAGAATAADAGSSAGIGGDAMSAELGTAGEAGASSALADLALAKGGQVDALLSPGEKVLSPKEAQAAKAGKVNPMAAGAEVPGKPKVGGAKNSYDNDFVPAKLAPGSVVLPRSVTQSDDPASKAKKFVEALKSKKGK